MSKKKTDMEKVEEFIRNHEKPSRDQIGDGTGIKGIVLTNILKKLGSSGLTQEGTGKDAVFWFEEAKGIAEEITEVQEEQAAEGLEPVITKGRDNSTFRFNGTDYKKGPLVRAVVAQYVTDNPKITYKQLKEVFPDDLLKRFGIFQDEETARALSNGRDRYFFKPEHEIKLKDKVVFVCNQFTAENIIPFLKTAKALNFKIK